MSCDAVASLIADVSLVEGLSPTLFGDFDGQVPRERTVDFRNRASGGDWGSAEHASKTSARTCALRVAMFQGIDEHPAKECNVS